MTLRDGRGRAEGAQGERAPDGIHGRGRASHGSHRGANLEARQRWQRELQLRGRVRAGRRYVGLVFLFWCLFTLRCIL